MSGKKVMEHALLSKGEMLAVMDRIRSDIENDARLSPPSHRLQGALDAAAHILEEIYRSEPLKRIEVDAAQQVLAGLQRLAGVFIAGDVECAPGCPACLPQDERSCKVCGCTDEDCSGCVERTGGPCFWVEEDLCSACAVALLEG